MLVVLDLTCWHVTFEGLLAISGGVAASIMMPKTKKTNTTYNIIILIFEF